jgi:RNA polymerase sigma-70 factor (ECF subfamily)
MNEERFEELFTKYYSMLCVIAYDYVKDKSLAEEMVGDTFLAIWEKRDSIVDTPAIKYYLIKSTQNTCLQYIRKKKLETQSIHSVPTEKLIAWSDDYPLGRLFEKEISDIIEQTVQSFPPQIQKVFLLSRFSEMTYSQIARILNVSENTIKTQIKIALSRLRDALKDYL